jgi:predicted extracellular nuclease
MSIRARGRTWWAAIGGAALVASMLPVTAALADEPSIGPAVVISEVYGGGGNSGAAYTHDYIEVFNRGDAPASLDGWSVQYASATGSTWQITALSGTLQPGQAYLIQQAQGAGGTEPLPTPDAVGAIAMSATNGKVALVNSTTALSGTCPTAGVVDFVGYGSANCFEGTGAAPALTNTTAATRDGGGCVDTDDNAADFTSVPAFRPDAPRNTTSPLTPCGTVEPPPPVGAAVVISEVYGGGGNSGATYTHDYIEVFNRGDVPASLDGWSVQYASAAGSTWSVTALSGTLQPGQAYLIQQAAGAGGTTPLPTPDAVGSTNMAATNGKVALVDSTTPLSGTCPTVGVVDFVGFGSTANCFEGTGPTPTLSNTNAATRNEGGCVDTDDNAADFTVVAAAPPDRPRNTSSPLTPCDGSEPEPPDPAPTLTCPVGMRTVETYATDGPVTATFAGGEITDLQITSVTPAPAVGELGLTDVTLGQNASATIVVPDDLRLVTPTSTADVRPLAVEITATAEGGQQGTCTASVNVIPLIPIGAVQGVIADGQTSFTSPLLNAEVAVRGVITQLTVESNGNRGLFLQNRPELADGDPLSSDGIFLFNGNFTTIRTDFDGPAVAEFGANYPVAVGDELVIRGTVGQFFGMTQLAGGSSFVWDRTAAGLDVEAAVEIPEVNPPDDAGDSLRYFRRHLGMQLEVPAGSLVVGGRDVFSGTDAEVWAIRGDHPVALRDDPYARRVFRDAHPLDNNPETNFDDGNGYRFVLGSFGVKGSTDDPDAVLAPAKTFDTITEANRGGVYLSFGKYTINVADQLALDTSGPDPAANSPVQPADRERELSIAAYNVENLYDFRDSPNSGCDFENNPGCFDDAGGSVTPPFNYVPDSDEVYQARLVRMAEQIRLDLHAPDVVMVQETEAQDVCTVSDDWTPETGPALGADRLDCDLENVGEANTKTDGRPDSLLELALVIAEQGGPAYDAVFDLDAGDLRGITTAYLYRTDRVELLDADADDPVLGSDPLVDYDGTPLPFNSDVENPKALNAELPDRVASTCTASGATACDGFNVFSRGPSVGLFRVWRAGIGTSTWSDVYLVNNHQSSGPNNRVLQRTEQATYNARIAEAILAVDPDARVVVGGDLNVFPRPDDPYPPGVPIHPVIGVGPSDQLRALYDSKLSNLYEDLVASYPAAAYSFGFQGQAQTLDHLWVSPTLLNELIDVRSAKINVDWPTDARGEAPAYGRYGVSDHDPEAGTFDATATFDKVRALIAYLVESGQLAEEDANSILARLDQAENHLAAGRVQAARAMLDSIVHTLDDLVASGAVTPNVATGLAAEIDQLQP